MKSMIVSSSEYCQAASTTIINFHRVQKKFAFQHRSASGLGV